MRASLSRLSLLLFLVAASSLLAQDEDEGVLPLSNEAGGPAVQMQHFFNLIHDFFPDASGRWDPSAEVMRLRANGVEFEVPAGRPLILVDGDRRAVQRPLITRQGRVMIPLPTVEIILRELGVPYEYDPGDNQEPERPDLLQTPTPPPAPLPAIPDLRLPPTATPDLAATQTLLAPALRPTPLAVSTPAPPANETAYPPSPVASQPDAAGSPPVVLLPGDTEPTQGVPPRSGEDAMALQPPAPLAGKIGLTWSQLTDLDHRRPPSRIALTHDEELADLAARIEQKLRSGLNLSVARVPVRPGGRAGDALAAQVNASQPQLCLDITANPLLPDQDPAALPLMIWVVNEALWPDDHGQSPGEAGTPRTYLRHEFQSLALGSLLRNALGQQSDLGENVQYELAPSYLLRRVDAPSAALLVPVGPQVDTNAARNELIAIGVYTAVARYVTGMTQAQF